MTPPNVLDRAKPTPIDQCRRSKRAEQATTSEIGQLRRVAGSLAWLARTCRSELSFAVNQLRSAQDHARVRKLVDADKLLHEAVADKEKGIFFPKVDFRMKSAMILSINDASHAASFIMMLARQWQDIALSLEGSWLWQASILRPPEGKGSSFGMDASK